MSEPEAWLAGPEAWLAGPEAWLTGPEAWLTGPEAWLAGLEAWLAGMNRQKISPFYRFSVSKEVGFSCGGSKCALEVSKDGQK